MAKTKARTFRFDDETNQVLDRMQSRVGVRNLTDNVQDAIKMWGDVASIEFLRAQRSYYDRLLEHVAAQQRHGRLVSRTKKA